MAEFVCKVADASGRVYSQVEPAESISEARQKLSDRGLFVYQVRPREVVFGAALGQRRAKTVHGNDFLVFNQQFNTLIKAGIPILKALDLLAERAAAPRLRPILGAVRRLVREGTTLSEALQQQGVFPKVYTTSVLAGEKSGNLSGVLEYYIAYQRVTTGLRKKLIATLIYPTILVCAATLIVTYLVSTVIPKFALLYGDLNINLPAATRILLAITVTYRPFLLAAIGIVVVLALAAFAWSRSDKGGLALERLRMRLPMVGLIEPAILMFMAVLIAFILVALYLPMFSMSAGG